MPPNTLIGIRAENITIATPGLAFAVDLVEPLGPETHIHGSLAHGQRLTLRRPGPPPETAALTISLPREALHYFDASTGDRREI